MRMNRRRRNYTRVKGGDGAGLRKKARRAAAAILACYFFASFIFGEMGLVKYYRMKAQYRDLVEEISRLKQDNARLASEVHGLRSDSAVIERLARDNLGLARKGETVYYYDEAYSNPRTKDAE